MNNDKNQNKEDQNNKDKKSNTGCFILAFILIASGIPLALKNESTVRSFGIIPIVIIGLIISYYVAKALSDKD